jgi:DNA-binding transcriptional LysR family regulator
MASQWRHTSDFYLSRLDVKVAKLFSEKWKVRVNRLESMRVLVEVVEAGSLSAAGRKLGMPLATVSRKISLLEAHLKIRLLTRSARQLALTEAARAYVAACRRILDEVHEAERAATGEYSAPRGDLVVTAPIVLGRLHVLPVVSEFLKVFPEVNVRLVLGDHVMSLLEEHVDLAVRVGTLPDSGLVGTGLGKIRRVICASPGYIATRGVPRKPEDLAAHQCVSFEHFGTADTWRFDVDGAEVTVPIHPRLVVTTAEGAIDAAISGVGVTRVFSYQVAAPLDDERLDLLLRRFEPASMPVSFLHSGGSRLPLKLRALLDFATPRLRARLQDVEAALARRARRTRNAATTPRSIRAPASAGRGRRRNSSSLV